MPPPDTLCYGNGAKGWQAGARFISRSQSFYGSHDHVKLSGEAARDGVHFQTA
jgi:hypothetical protein